MNRFVLIFLLAFLLASPFVCSAQNLVTNGGFELGSFAGWSQFGDTGFTAVCTVDNPSEDCSQRDPHSGTWSADFGSEVTTGGGISQDIATTPGNSYTLSFWLDNCHVGCDATTNSFSVSFGGTTLLSIAGRLGFDWTFYQFTVTADAASEPLTFNIYQFDDYYDLDDISVTQVDETPEPASLTLLASALALGAGFVRKFPS